MALSTDKNLEMMFPNVGHIIPAKSNVAGTYYKGALVDFDSDGYIVVAADVANHAFAGICQGTCRLNLLELLGNQCCVERGYLGCHLTCEHRL